MAFILLVSGMLIGLGGVLLDIFPTFPLPSQLDLSPEGSIAVLLAGLSYSAVILSWPPARLTLAILMGLFGAHGVNAHFPLLGVDVGVIGEEPLPLMPAILLLLFSACCLVGRSRARYRLFWRWVGWLGTALGVSTLLTHAWETFRLVTGSLLSDIELLGGVLALAFGMIVRTAARERVGEEIEISCRAMKVGALGVLVSMLVWLLGSWALDIERRDEAQNLANNLGLTIEQIEQDHAGLLLRLVERWGAQSGLPGKAMRDIEAHGYLRDVSSLQAMLVMNPGTRMQWRQSRSPESLLWLMDRVVEAETLSWISSFRESSRRLSWNFIDPSRPSLALVATRDRINAEQLLIAVVDFDVLIDHYVRRATHDYRIDISNSRWLIDSIAPSDGEKRGEYEVYGSSTITLPSGPELQLDAYGAPPSILTLSGALPPGLGLIGLLFSYQLMMSLTLASIRETQTRDLELSQERFRSLFTQNPDAVVVMDPEGVVRAVNPAARPSLVESDAEILGTPFLEILRSCSSGGDRPVAIASAFESAKSGYFQSFEMNCLHDGGSKNFEVSFMPIMAQGYVDGVFGILRDVTERKSSEERLRVLERSLEASRNGVAILDVRSDTIEYVYINPAFSVITGYSPAEVLGRSPGFLIGAETDPEDIKMAEAAVRDKESLNITLRSYKKDGSLFWNQLFLSPVRDPKEEVTHFVCIMNDISAEKEQEAKLAYQATHDVLTGLPNRALFNDRLRHDLHLAGRNHHTLGVLFIDLDEFKPINDTLGHKIGDMLLMSVARRLSQSLRSGDTLARFGGDEFVLLLPDLKHQHEAEEVAERLLDELARTHRVEGHDLHVSASIGIALLDDPNLEDPEKLIQRADMAMYKAKQQGRNAYQLFTSDLDLKLSERVAIRSELQEAMEKQQLDLYYQPLIDQRGRVCGAEALVRWHHPLRGWISPAQFIPLAEETGQIVELSRWVMRQAFLDTRRLVAQGLLQGRVAINMSPMQFHRPNFLMKLRQMLEETELPAEYVELELTEGILMRDSEGAIDILNALSGMGVSVAIDDFGTGYSSLSYLRTLPIDKIKIDRSFTRDVIESEKDSAVCKGVITLAKEMDLKVLAEGIETQAQLEYLLALGCEAFQGYHFAKPMPFDEFVRYLEAERTLYCPDRG